MLHESRGTRIRNAVVKRIRKPVWYFVYRLTGVRLQTPTRYLDLSMIGARFTVPALKAKGVLPSNKLTPIERTPGIAELDLLAWEYRRVDILFPYNGFAIFIPVVYNRNDKAQELPGYYFLYLPVTTEDARWGGVEIYGFPKFLAEIGFEDTAESRSCRLRAKGKNIIILEVKKLTIQSQSWDICCLTVKGRELVRSIFQVQGQRGSSDAPGGATFTLGDHPIAEELRALGIDQTSFQHEYLPQGQALFSKPLEALPL